jgi:hypothetical protein
MSETTVSPTISKRTVFNYVTLFNITKSVVTRLIGQTTNKTDKIIFNSLSKAVKKYHEGN